MDEMEDAVKQLTLDEKELESKISRRKLELERAEKRLKGIAHVKPEHQEECDKLELELERFYAIYVEKFANIDFLEYEMDKFTKIEKTNLAKADHVRANIRDQENRDNSKALRGDDDDDGDAFNEN